MLIPPRHYSLILNELNAHELFLHYGAALEGSLNRLHVLTDPQVLFAPI